MPQAGLTLLNGYALVYVLAPQYTPPVLDAILGFKVIQDRLSCPMARRSLTTIGWRALVALSGASLARQAGSP